MGWSKTKFTPKKTSGAQGQANGDMRSSLCTWNTGGGRKCFLKWQSLRWSSDSDFLSVLVKPKPCIPAACFHRQPANSETFLFSPLVFHTEFSEQGHSFPPCINLIFCLILPISVWQVTERLFLPLWDWTIAFITCRVITGYQTLDINDLFLTTPL